TTVFVGTRQIAPKVLALVGGAIDEGVDGLEPQGPQATLVAGLEPSGDLFGSPSFRKTIADESPQRRIFLEYGFTPPAQLIGSGGVKRRITPAGQGGASQFPRYGGFRSLKCPGSFESCHYIVLPHLFITLSYVLCVRDQDFY